MSGITYETVRWRWDAFDNPAELDWNAFDVGVCMTKIDGLAWEIDRLRGELQRRIDQHRRELEASESLSDERADRVRAFRAEIDRLKAELAEAKAAPSKPPPDHIDSAKFGWTADGCKAREAAKAFGGSDQETEEKGG